MLRATLDELSAVLHVSRPVRLVEAAWVQVPAVVGALRPVLLFPATALTGLTPGQLRALLAHELAHVRRHDYAANLLQTMLQTLLFYHPAVWWASARMREEREYCCDDVAAAASGDRVTYARALAAMEELRALPVRLALAARGGSLLRRVQRLLGVAPSPGMNRGRNRSLVAAALAVAFAAIPLAAPQLGAAPPAGAAASRPAVPATGPATEPAESAVTPEDLVADVKDYEIQPNDLVSVEVGELQGPGTKSVKTARVSQTGMISLPFIGQIKVGGLDDMAAEKAIAKAYQDKNILAQAQVGLSVVEARGRSFSVIGGAGRPGQYSIVEPDFRLLDAMTIAAIDPKADGLYILRRTLADAKKSGAPPPQARKIRVALDKLVAGDLNLNLVIRPGDLIVVEATPRTTARLVVGPDGVTFQGNASKWDDLAAAMEAIPQAERGRTTIRISPATPDLTLRQYSEARTRAAALAKRLGFAGTADDAFDGAGGGGAVPAGVPAPAPAGEGGPRGAADPPAPVGSY
jgi:protein involved in polysaccharide export with SLBB domain